MIRPISRFSLLLSMGVWFRLSSGRCCKTKHGDKCVCRYDTAHGCPHLDIVNTRGQLLEKKWLLEMSIAEALRFAIEDFKQNYADYVKNFS